MEFDVWYSCHSCKFGTHLVTEMREHVKNEHGVAPIKPEDLLRHVVNEWADGLCNAKVWMENVRDKISTPEEALVAIQSDIAHARQVAADTVKQIKEIQNV